VANETGADARLTEHDGVLTLTFDRPGKLNAINPAMTALLWEAARALGDREDARVLVITGRGRYFTAGIDLAELAADRRGGQLESDVAYRRTYRRHHLLYDEFEAIEKPVVLAASVPGWKWGRRVTSGSPPSRHSSASPKRSWA
jgi:enoyl-CoA hydratase